MANIKKPKVYQVATAHLDTVWNWTLEQTIKEYLPSTCLENFRLFENYPHYAFNFEGAYRYALIKEYYPEYFSKLKEYVAAGRWHVTGSSWENGDGERSYLWNGEGGQSLEDALASENAIPTKEAAIEEAKKLLSSEYWKMDVENGWKWSVTNDSYGIMNRRNYGVSGQKGKDSVMLYMAVDGSGAWYISHEGDPYYLNDYVLEHEYVKKTNLSQKEQDSIKQFCLDFMELAEPGETQYLQEIYINGFMTVNDTLYVQLEAPYNQNSSKTFLVQVKPELRLIDYWTGNG